MKLTRTKATVVDGPFAEVKELIAGYWILQVKSKEEAIEWAKRCPRPDDDSECVLELRQITSSRTSPRSSCPTRPRRRRRRSSRRPPRTPSGDRRLGPRSAVTDVFRTERVLVVHATGPVARTMWVHRTGRLSNQHAFLRDVHRLLALPAAAAPAAA